MPSPDNPGYADLIDRLATAATQCRSLVREMHAASKDLHLAIREARKQENALRAAVQDESRRQIEEAVRTQVIESMKDLGEFAQTAMDATANKVSAEFDRLTEPMLKTLGLLEVAIEERQDDVR